MPENIENPRHDLRRRGEERDRDNYDVVLAEIKQAMIYLSRDVNELKVNQAKVIDKIVGDVEQLKAWRERTDSVVKILSRAQALLYIVFSAGFVMGVYIS